MNADFSVRQTLTKASDGLQVCLQAHTASQGKIYANSILILPVPSGYFCIDFTALIVYSVPFITAL